MKVITPEVAKLVTELNAVPGIDRSKVELLVYESAKMGWDQCMRTVQMTTEQVTAQLDQILKVH
jgi:hypothetical protein